jgi:hypothetical protein
MPLRAYCRRSGNPAQPGLKIKRFMPFAPACLNGAHGRIILLRYDAPPQTNHEPNKPMKHCDEAPQIASQRQSAVIS